MDISYSFLWMPILAVIEPTSVLETETIRFIMDSGLYYYRVMLFDLKNARVTYQGLVNSMLRK